MASILGPLVGIWRGVNQPYFGKQRVKLAYSPQEQKRGILRDFPDKGMEKGARFGLILVLPLNTPLFNIYEVN
jgi:hypothetical protein